MKDQKIAKYDDVILLYLQGNHPAEIANIVELSASTVRRYIARARVHNFTSLQQKNEKIDKLKLLQDDILNELCTRDISLEDTGKLQQTLKTAHTMQRDEEGKNTGSLDVFFDLLEARQQNKQMIIEAEFEEIEKSNNERDKIEDISFL